jgi:hypothetical protein
MLSADSLCGRQALARLLAVALALGATACGTSDGAGAPPAAAGNTTVVPTSTVVPTTAATSPPAAPATTTTTAPERLSAASRLSLQGIGPVQVGMTLDEASTAAGTPIRTRPGDPFEPGCEYAYAAAVPEMAFMVINGRIARVDVGQRRGDRVTTVSGIGSGSTEDEVKRVYPGRIQVQRHPYVPTGHYLVYVPADSTLAHLSMIFETDGRVVTTFRSGLKGAVAQIEGCS